MRNDQYFRHDASASANQKLITLMLKEGARGYGVYWILLEMLRKRNDFRLPLDFLGAVSSICHTHRRVVERVVRDYDLFVVEDGYFYSPGMNKRMGAFLAKISKNSQESTPNSEDNRPESSDLPLLSARVEEERRKEQQLRPFPHPFLGNPRRRDGRRPLLDGHGGHSLRPGAALHRPPRRGSRPLSPAHPPLRQGQWTAAPQRRPPVLCQLPCRRKSNLPGREATAARCAPTAANRRRSEPLRNHRRRPPNLPRPPHPRQCATASR